MYKPDNVYRTGIILDLVAGLCQSIDDIRAGLMLSSSFSNEQKAPIHRILISAHYIIEEIDTWEDSVPEHWKCQYHITITVYVQHTDTLLTLFSKHRLFTAQPSTKLCGLDP